MLGLNSVKLSLKTVFFFKNMVKGKNHKVLKKPVLNCLSGPACHFLNLVLNVLVRAFTLSWLDILKLKFECLNVI